ncbi:MAG: AraC family transcriptional regulator [Pseudomonadota bacterium]|nr:AraC family transcriptional regulator [Pseudomonadota bacterium]
MSSPFLTKVLRRMRRLAVGIGLVAAATAAADEPVALADEIESLKQELLALNRDLFLLEEDLLTPTDTQVLVFVSAEPTDWFQLDSVQLLIDNKEVANYLYTPRELNALARGGVHRIHRGNLDQGAHEVTAFFIGIGPEGRPMRRGATLKFEKALGPKYLELQMAADEPKRQADFWIEEW